MVQELCQSLYEDKEEMALALEDTTIVLAALVPWSVAAAVPPGPRCLILGHCRCRLPLLAATMELAAHIFSQT